MIRRGGQKIATRMRGSRVVAKVYKGSYLVYRRAWIDVSADVSFTAAGGTETLVVDCSPGLAWSAKSVPAYLSLSAMSGTGPATIAVTAENNTTNSVRSGTFVFEGDGLQTTVSYSQAAGVKIYEIPLVSFSYANISPSATSASPVLSYSQLWTWNGLSESGEEVTSGADVSYSLASSQNGFSAINASSGILTATNMGTTTGSRASGNVTVTVSLNGKTASKTALCTQGTNSKTLEKITVSSSSDTIPASGGSAVLYVTAYYAYESGASSSENAANATSFTLDSGSAGSVTANTLTLPNRGNVEGSDIFSYYTGFFGGKTAQGSVRQLANTKIPGKLKLLSDQTAFPIWGGCTRFSVVRAFLFASGSSNDESVTNFGIGFEPGLDHFISYLSNGKAVVSPNDKEKRRQGAYYATVGAERSDAVIHTQEVPDKPMVYIGVMESSETPDECYVTGYVRGYDVNDWIQTDAVDVTWLNKRDNQTGTTRWWSGSPSYIGTLPYQDTDVIKVNPYIGSKCYYWCTTQYGPIDASEFYK